MVEIDLATASRDKDGTLVVTRTELVRPISKVVRLAAEEEAPTVPEKRKKAIHHVNKDMNRTTTVAGFILALIFSNIQQAKAQAPADLPLTSTAIIGTLALVLAVAGVICNFTVILRILMSPRKRQALHLYQCSTLGLHIVDLIMAAIIIPLTASRYLTRKWMLGITMCRVYSFLLYGNVAWILSSLIMITFIRSLCLVTAKINTNAIRKTLFCLPLLSFLLPLLALTNVWGQIETKPEDPSSCTIMPLNGSSPKRMIWIVGVFTPFIMIYVMSAVIYFKIRQQQRLFPESTRKTRMLTRLRNTIIGVLTSFLCGYQPILTLNAIDNQKKWINPNIHVISMFLAWTTTIIHPIIYLMARPLRKGLCRPGRMQPPMQKISTGTVANQTNTLKRIRVVITSLLIIQAPLGAQGSMVTNQETSGIAGIPSTEQGVQFETFKHFPIPLSQQVLRLPICAEVSPPVKPVHACTNAAYWLSIRADATACINHKKCLPEMAMNQDATQCHQSPKTVCPTIQYQIDKLQCQVREVPSNQAVHIIMRNVLTDYCAVGNLHLRNCDDWTDVIGEVAGVLIKGTIYPLDELHLSEDALLQDISSYNCSFTTDCLNRKCTGDSVFCRNIGCVMDLTEAETACHCSLAHNKPVTVLQTKDGGVY